MDCLFFCICFYQEGVVSVAGQEALQLGILFGTENPSAQDEYEDVFSFGHKSLQEFAAGGHVAKMNKVGLKCTRDLPKILVQETVQ